jgi:hypothetical protein
MNFYGKKKQPTVFGSPSQPSSIDSDGPDIMEPSRNFQMWFVRNARPKISPTRNLGGSSHPGHKDTNTGSLACRAWLSTIARQFLHTAERRHEKGKTSGWGARHRSIIPVNPLAPTRLTAYQNADSSEADPKADRISSHRRRHQTALWSSEPMFQRPCQTHRSTRRPQPNSS